jgi:hypothetical protein
VLLDAASSQSETGGDAEVRNAARGQQRNAASNGRACSVKRVWGLDAQFGFTGMLCPSDSASSASAGTQIDRTDATFDRVNTLHSYWLHEIYLPSSNIYRHSGSQIIHRLGRVAKDGRLNMWYQVEPDDHQYNFFHCSATFLIHYSKKRDRTIIDRQMILKGA